MLENDSTYYIKRIKLINVRCFRKLDLNILGNSSTPRMRTVMIGKNGTCKSTVLRCIALGLCDRSDADSLLSEPFGLIVTEGCKSAEIIIDISEKTRPKETFTLKTIIERAGGKEVIEKKLGSSMFYPIFVGGYGAARATDGQDEFRDYRTLDSVYTLFQYQSDLIGPELIMRRLEDFLGDDNYNKTMSGIKRALGLSPRDHIRVKKGGGVEIVGPSSGKGPIPLEGWADGYRITFNWILDLYSWAMKAEKVTSSGGISGIVLLDEIEQHLHPSMQTTMLNNFSKLFPQIQLITTTHSPLVTLGAKAEEIVVFRKKQKWVYADEDIPDLSGYSAEDVILDKRLFNTPIFPVKTESILKQYNSLYNIDQSKRTEKQKETLKKLSNKLITQQSIGKSETPLSRELNKLKIKYNL